MALGTNRWRSAFVGDEHAQEGERSIPAPEEVEVNSEVSSDW